MRTVLSMTEIKSQIGYARAWVRLTLEKKVLATHLTTLLSRPDLLRSLYKRYAFLRSDDEKEQFLSYLLSLNVVDYYCFTNTYLNTCKLFILSQWHYLYQYLSLVRIQMCPIARVRLHRFYENFVTMHIIFVSVVPYRVVIFPSRKLSGASTSANAWVSLAGSLGQTENIPITRNHLEFVFQVGRVYWSTILYVYLHCCSRESNYVEPLHSTSWYQPRVVPE